jgi:hypothetical protein
MKISAPNIAVLRLFASNVSANVSAEAVEVLRLFNF